ncbi:MAG: DUF1015 domain-containing protein [Pseudomonadota bacterium]
MAIIKPFRGYLYNREKIENLSLAVAPPYDVITPEQQTQYYQKHPLNIIRLILGKEEPTDNESNNKYTRAAHYLSTWKEDNTLIRVTNPSLYFYTQDFSLPGGELRQRKGFICLFKLEEFRSGVILPHERTLSKPKADRLNLRLACHANFNPIFSLYADPGFTIEKCIDAVGENPSYFDITDDNGVRHKLWLVDRSEIIKTVKEVIKNKTLLIADGHHRYETALTYQNLMREKYLGSTEDEAFNYTMMYFTNMNDVGLVILPTHRLVKNIDFNPAQFFNQAQQYFEIETIPASPENDHLIRTTIIATMQKEAKERYLFTLFSSKQNSYFIFRLKDFALLNEVIDRSMSLPLRTLDANIMEFLVFNHLLGVSCNDPRFEENIKFVHTDEEAISLVKSGRYEVAFLVNPTRIEQVKEIVAQGEIMPQKSTYFYPKLLSGLVINQMDPEESIA